MVYQPQKFPTVIIFVQISFQRSPNKKTSKQVSESSLNGELLKILVHFRMMVLSKTKIIYQNDSGIVAQ